MMVEKELIVTGKTIDEAIEKGLQELGLDRDSISVEVLATPTRGFLFGIGATDAKVRLAYEVEEAEPPRQPRQQKPARSERAEQPKPQPAAEQTERPKPAPQPRPEQAAREKKPEVPRPARELRSEQPRSEQPRSEQPREKRPAPPAEPARPFTPVQGSDAERFLREVLAVLDIEANIVAETDGDILKLSLTGDNMGLLIGRRGETMDALQYLTGLATNRGEEGYGKVSLDIENYRAKREEALVSLANKVAQRVLKERKTVTLEAMNPYERRIIHATLQSVPGVQTGSVGHEPNRRVVVSLSGGGGSGGGDKNRRRKPRRRGGKGRPGESAAPAGQTPGGDSAAPEQAPEREQAFSVSE